MIQVKDIVKSFEGNVVLNHVSANFEDGKVNMIIGQSGSGKTVLMKSMIGLHQIDAGQIIFDTRNGQENLAEMKEKEVRMLHREVGMLFQGAALFDSMTVQENVMYPLEMFSQMSREEMVERARFCLERVNMPERAFGLMPSEISGGMQKRVAIARAIALNPKYLFCDEPNSGLDPKTSLVIDQLIQDITQEYGICTVVNSVFCFNCFHFGSICTVGKTDNSTDFNLTFHMFFCLCHIRWWNTSRCCAVFYSIITDCFDFFPSCCLC